MSENNSDKAKVRKTVPAIRSAKRSNGNDPLVMVTGYDYPAAQILDRAGVDIILVGDSLSNVVLGNKSTTDVSMDDMVHHVKAVANAQTIALVVADLPWLSFHLNPENSILNAAALVKAGATAVKLEGGKKRSDHIKAIIDAEIPVMGHIGLTPQSVNVFGGFKVQGKTESQAEALINDAIDLEKAGCFSIVLEAVPRNLAKTITDTIKIPTIGIGAGPDCDGQVIVFHDLLGFYPDKGAKFVRRYLDFADLATEAINRFIGDVKSGNYPNDEESYH